jgi:two-component system, NarL family, nitrate/nitrite response regulator NarL
MTLQATPEQRAAPTQLPRLVIADDDSLTRSMLVSQLDREFECVGVAADATGAIALVVAEHPDVVILDVNMPGGGAIQATREIHAASPETAIVILSIDETWSDLIELLNAGAMTYLRKGIDAHTLAHDLKASIKAKHHAAVRGVSDNDKPRP